MICGMYVIQGFPEYDATGIYENTRLVHKMQLDYDVNDRIFGILLNQMVNSEAGLKYIKLCNRTCPSRTIKSTMYILLLLLTLLLLFFFFFFLFFRYIFILLLIGYLKINSMPFSNNTHPIMNRIGITMN